MKYVSIICLFILSVALADRYTDKYDDLDINEVISNKRLLVSYLKCFLDKGPCTPEGKEVKLHIKDAMETGCQKCTETQRKKARIVVRHVRDSEKTYWEEMTKKFDPNNQFKEVYENFLARDD